MTPREAGFAAGGAVDGWGGACPFGHDRLPERQAWFDGFSDGRRHRPPPPMARHPEQIMAEPPEKRGFGSAGRG